MIIIQISLLQSLSKQLAKGDWRVEDHLKCPKLSISYSLLKNRRLINDLDRWRLNAESMKNILQSIQNFISYLDETPTNYELGFPVTNQEGLWAANLDNKLASLQERLRYLSNRNGEMEKIVYFPHVVFLASMRINFYCLDLERCGFSNEYITRFPH